MIKRQWLSKKYNRCSVHGITALKYCANKRICAYRSNVSLFPVLLISEILSVRIRQVQSLRSDAGVCRKNLNPAYSRVPGKSGVHAHKVYL